MSKTLLHRDDIIDITDFDYVQYLYNIDKMMLNEELATAIMLGDGGKTEMVTEDFKRPYPPGFGRTTICIRSM